MLQVKQGGEFSGDQERPNGRTRGGLGDRSRRLPAGVYAAAVSGRGGELCPRWAATSWRHPAALRRPGRHSHRQPEPAPPLAPRRQLPRPWARPRSSPRRSHCSTRACLLRRENNVVRKKKRLANIDYCCTTTRLAEVQCLSLVIVCKQGCIISLFTLLLTRHSTAAQSCGTGGPLRKTTMHCVARHRAAFLQVLCVP